MRDKLYKWILFVLIAYTSDASIPSQQITAYQYYFNSDPGVGITGNGAVISVTPDSVFTGTLSIAIPGSLSEGLNYLYIRVQDEDGRWSLAERRPFYVMPVFNNSTITDWQYYFDTDPGVGIAGNGAIVPVNPDSVFSSTVAIATPGSLSNGLHYLYIRVKDNFGRWSIAERRAFFIMPVFNSSSITDWQYYFDIDPGVGIAGNGAIIPVNPDSVFNSTVAITIPGSLSNGLHYLYVRAKDNFGRWSLIERRTFFIQPQNTTQKVTDLEYYFDTDPGTGNGYHVPVADTSDYSSVISIGIPCLTVGNHYFYLRAKDEYGRWSIISRDTLNITTGVAASGITPAGLTNICSIDSVNYSTIKNPGIVYQWLLNDNPIAGATNNSYAAHLTGDYSLITSCNSYSDTSNITSVYVLPDVNPGTVSGVSELCYGNKTAFISNGDGGGIWTSSDTSIAVVDPDSGIVLGGGAGNAAVSYTIQSGCGSPATSTDTIHILNCPAHLKVKLFLEGFYSGSGMMDNYGAGGCLYTLGMSADPLDADSVYISAMNAETLLETERKAVLLKTDGTTDFTFGNDVIYSSLYYLKVNHRNAIETWSALPVLMDTSVTNYDFTNAVAKSYGNNMIDVGTPLGESPAWALFSGDISDATLGLGYQDGVIESQDYSDIENAVYSILGGYLSEDITGDGVVESMDYSLMENNVYFIISSMRP